MPLYMLAWKGAFDDEGIYWSTSDSNMQEWAPQQNIAGVRTSHSPAVAQAFINVDELTWLLAWKGESGDPQIYWSTFDFYTYKWAPPQFVGVVGTSHGPTLATVNQGATVFLAWKGEFDDPNIYWSTFNPNTNAWAPQQHVVGVGTSHGPTLAAVNNGMVFLAWKGEFDDPNIYWSTFDFNTSTWAPQQVVSDVQTSSSPALAALDQSTLYIAWKGAGNDESIYYSNFDYITFGRVPFVQGAGTSSSPTLAGTYLAPIQ